MNSVFLVIVIGGFLVLGIGMLFCIYWLIKLRKRFESAFAKLDSKENLVDTIKSYYKKITTSEKHLAQIHKSYDHLTSISAKSMQKVAIVRFNPFRDTGGNQSFVLALLDNHDSGMLLTSIHSREGTRVYIKSVDYGNSQQQLSEEETQALKQAKHGATTINKHDTNA